LVGCFVDVATARTLAVPIGAALERLNSPLRCLGNAASAIATQVRQPVMLC
jgi:hypothetical protein